MTTEVDPNSTEPPTEAPENATVASIESMNPPAGASSAPEAEAASEEPTSPEEIAAAEISRLEEERKKLRNQLLRTAADFDNFRKRTKRDLDDTSRRAKEDILQQVLPVIDNLERAVGAATQASDVNTVIDGVQMVLNGFRENSSQMGLERVDALYKGFDPSIHEAVQQIPSDEHPVGTVIAEIVPGYTFAGKLLRAAMVVVSTAAVKTTPSAAPEPSSEASAGSIPAPRNSEPTTKQDQQFEKAHSEAPEADE